jgi:hypothetical protein
MRSDAGSSFLSSRRRHPHDAVTQLLSLSDNTKPSIPCAHRPRLPPSCPHFHIFLIHQPAPSAYSASHVTFACMMRATKIGAIPSAALKWRLLALGGPVQEPSGTAPTSTSPAVQEMRPGLLHHPLISQPDSHWAESSSLSSPSILRYSSLFAVR